MSSLTKAQGCDLQDYSVRELSWSTKMAIKNKHLDRLINAFKSYILLNGSCGNKVRNINAEDSGYFLRYIDSKFYQELENIKSMIDIYERYVDTGRKQIQNIRKEFDKINSFWNKIVVSNSKVKITSNITVSDMENNFQKLSEITLRDHYQYNGLGWLQIYNYLLSEFQSLEQICIDQKQYYQEGASGNIIWYWLCPSKFYKKGGFISKLTSWISPLDWYQFVFHGFTSNSLHAERYEKFKSIAIFPNKDILINRINDLMTATELLTQLDENIKAEETTSLTRINCQRTQVVADNTSAFKNECMRLFSHIRDRVGFISN